MQTSTALKIAAAILLIASVSAFALFTYRPGAGSPINWDTGDNDPVSSFYPVGDKLFLVTDSNVSLLNQSGNALWTRQFPGSGFSALGEDGLLYVYSRDQGITSIDISGNIASDGKFDINRPPLIDRAGTMYLRSWTKMAAMGKGGIEIWNDSVVLSDPAIDAGDNVYYLVRQPSHPSDVYMISRSPDGKQRWSLLFDRYFSDTALAPADDGVYAYSPTEGEVCRVNGGGNVSWKYYKPYMGQYQPAPGENGNVFLVYQRGTVHVLSPEGYLLSKYSLESAYDLNYTALPAVSNDTLYTVGPDRSPSSAILYATGLDGGVLWKAQVNSSGQCRVFASGSTVCIATELQKGAKLLPVLYIFNDGSLHRALYSGDGQPWDQITIVNNTIYARTFGGRLYSLKGE